MKHVDFDFDALERHKQEYFNNGGKVELIPSQTTESYKRSLYEAFPVSTVPDESDQNDETANNHQINETIHEDY